MAITYSYPQSLLGSWVKLDQGLIKTGLFQPVSLYWMHPVSKILTDPEKAREKLLKNDMGIWILKRKSGTYQQEIMKRRENSKLYIHATIGKASRLSESEKPVEMPYLQPTRSRYYHFQLDVLLEIHVLLISGLTTPSRVLSYLKVLWRRNEDGENNQPKLDSGLALGFLLLIAKVTTE
ncbi:uncharacterized protein C8R40DRAFT_1268132 [Lentinula edodes]|uniref:uncharacterized protein n=1 Tax=Lentinula edodes TaxID=5353 RepID=UPI001E8DB78D|nr:uncharacterized protein C8R40DRAFT_1268132 [Lentinula edodes]KAH7870304.1 hypothetical protein C8R40DRAFT_1268132 [Lentinula edodes]